MPYAGAFGVVGRRVLVAWDGTREASRALHDALPLIGKAEAVTVMTVRAREASFERDAPSLERIVRHLERHGIAARTDETLHGDVPIADLLLSRAADLDDRPDRRRRLSPLAVARGTDRRGQPRIARSHDRPGADVALTLRVLYRSLARFSTESTHSARITPTPTRPHRGGGST